MNDEGLNIFSDNLARIRKTKRLTQYDLAARSGISRAMIGYYENTGTIPPMDKLQTIAKALGIPVSRLFEQAAGETGPGEPDTIDPRARKRYHTLFEHIQNLPQNERTNLYKVLDTLLGIEPYEPKFADSGNFQKDKSVDAHIKAPLQIWVRKNKNDNEMRFQIELPETLEIHFTIEDGTITKKVRLEKDPLGVYMSEPVTGVKNISICKQIGPVSDTSKE